MSVEKLRGNEHASFSDYTSIKEKLLQVLAL